ncbi:Endonuclease/exonuclease/phosphatase, partial [Geopyxis carbonaria]
LATSKTKETSKTPISEPTVTLKPSYTGSDPFLENRNGFTRGSLDIPRTGSSADERPVSRNDSFRSNTLPRGYVSRQRPLSVYSTFSPPRSPPSFRVESPRSPPKPLNLDSSTERARVSTGLGTPCIKLEPSRPPGRPPSPSPRIIRSGKSPPPPVSPRPIRPISISAAPNEVQTAEQQPFQRGYADTAPIQFLSSEPPPVPTRTSKPKIGGKPPIPPKHTRPDAIVPNPALAPTSHSDERISPFSTPPSSANNSPSRSDSESRRPLAHTRKVGFSSTTFTQRSPNMPTTNDRLEESGQENSDIFAGRNVVFPPPRMSVDQVRPRMKLEDSIKGQRMSLDASTRPDLPPRPSGLIGGVKARVYRGRSHSPPRAALEPVITKSFLPPPKRGQVNIRSRSPMGGIPGIPTVSPLFTPNEDLQASCYGIDDSDEGVSEDQSGLSDYPDSSQANRRRPYFKNGPIEIPCKSDVKLFAVCGQYVCTISHSTKVWDIDTGRCIMAIQHGEGIRVTAVAFKPSVKVEEEGTTLWLGTSHGELMEVDIPTQRTIDTRSSAHTKKEIVKIHRCGFELWTLDNGGKLQVWGPDMNGAPNLRNSPTTFRIHPRHSCSIAVDGLLWVGSGKSVDIYRPSTDPSKVFNISQRQLAPSKATGEITCAAIVNSQPDKVYFGHSDGKVSIYSRSTFSCIDVVSVSLYKINSMTGVGDHLWAGFKTGMVYVYDVRPKPWRALKDWQCSDGPIMQVVADRTSIWKNGRLQVVSLGADNVIRVWDGMLEEDWLESEMQKRDMEFCSFREIKALVCTWNAGASKPQDLLNRDSDKIFLEEVLESGNSPDIIVFGFQELVDLEDKKITAKSFLKKGSKKKRAADQQEHMSHQYRLWQQQLTKSIENHMEESYILLHVANLVGLFTCIFIKSSEKKNIRNVSASTVKRGLGGLHGNKGALVLRFLLDDSSLCFINCHLAAGQQHTISRNNDIAAILESTSLPPEPSTNARTDMFVGGGDGSMILDHEICILNGDLNYRIDLARESVIHKIKHNDLSSLLERDQLLTERRKNPGFRLRAFNEGQLTFPPTYKYNVGTDDYDSSEKKRTPAWCDRLLYRGLGKIKQVEYRRWEVKASDHRPVSGIFLIRVKTVDPTSRKRIWDRCVDRYEEVRAGYVLEAKMDYLVNVCGYEEDEARCTLKRKEHVVDALASLERRR